MASQHIIFLNIISIFLYFLGGLSSLLICFFFLIIHYIKEYDIFDKKMKNLFIV